MVAGAESGSSAQPPSPTTWLWVTCPVVKHGVERPTRLVFNLAQGLPGPAEEFFMHASDKLAFPVLLWIKRPGSLV